jgi:hypothetical protein
MSYAYTWIRDSIGHYLWSTTPENTTTASVDQNFVCFSTNVKQELIKEIQSRPNFKQVGVKFVEPIVAPIQLIKHESLIKEIKSYPVPNYALLEEINTHPLLKQKGVRHIDPSITSLQVAKHDFLIKEISSIKTRLRPVIPSQQIIPLIMDSTQIMFNRIREKMSERRLKINGKILFHSSQTINKSKNETILAETLQKDTIISAVEISKSQMLDDLLNQPVSQLITKLKAE